MRDPGVRVGQRGGAGRTQEAIGIAGAADNWCSCCSFELATVFETVIVGASAEIGRPRLSDAVDQLAPPGEFRRQVRRIRSSELVGEGWERRDVPLAGAVRSRHRAGMTAERQFATEHRCADDVVVIDHGMDQRLGAVALAELQAAKMIEIGAKIIPFAEADQERVVDPIRLQNIVEAVEAAESVIAFKRDVPAILPPGAEREKTLGLDRAAPAVEFQAVRRNGCLGAVQVVGVLVDGAELHGVLAGCEFLAPLALVQYALLGQVLGSEGEVVGVRQCEVVGHLEGKAERRRLADLRREEARAAFHRRVCVLEIRHVQDGDTEDFEPGVLVGDGRSRLVMYDSRGADAPQRRLAGIAFAGRELAVFEFTDIAVAADHTTCSNP